MDWPLFFKDRLKTGNLDSCIGICTLWTEKEKIHGSIQDSEYAVCGNLYTTAGINAMIKNVLANPKIRYIILCGQQMNRSGEALLSFMQNGIDDNRKVIGHDAVIDSNIPDELIELFRRNVSIIDMRGREDKVKNRLEELEHKGPFSEPHVIEGEETIDTCLKPICTGATSIRLEAGTIGEAWLKLLNAIIKFGEEKKSEYGTDQKELLNLNMVITGDDKAIAPWFDFSEDDLRKYYPSVLSGKKPDGVHYTYGERLFAFPSPEGSIDQVSAAIERLKMAPHSRRAMAVLYYPALDNRSDHAPCINQVIWNIKNSMLYQTTIIRSNDMFHAWPMNAYAMRKLQKQVAGALGMEPGPLTIISVSAHLYEDDWARAKDMLDKYYTGSSCGLEMDPHGYFLITLENNEIVAQHCLPNGQKTQYVFRGRKADGMYRRILHEGIILKLDHAAYLGRELARAEDALRRGEKYVQDENDKG